MIFLPCQVLPATLLDDVEINPQSSKKPLVLFGIFRIARGFFLCKKPRVFRLNFWKWASASQADTLWIEAVWDRLLSFIFHTRLHHKLCFSHQKIQLKINLTQKAKRDNAYAL